MVTAVPRRHGCLAPGDSAGASCLGLLAGAALAVLVLAVAGSELGLRGLAIAAVLLSGVHLLRTRGTRRAAAQRARLAAQVGDPKRLRGVWRVELRRAWAAYDAYHAAVETVPDGPLRQRLQDTGRQLTASLIRCGALARHGAGFELTLRRFSPGDLRRQLARVRRQQRRDPTAQVSATVEALQSQLASAEAMQRTADQVRRQLQVHANALSEVAARAAQLALRAGPAGDQEPVGSLTGPHQELASLAEALETLSAVPPPPGPALGGAPTTAR